MRPLTDEETRILFDKLVKYIGDNVRLLIDRSDGTYCFRFHRDRVYYCKEDIMKKAAHFPRKSLISFGTCFGKFSSKSQKFRLNVTALDFLAPYAKCKIWLKPNAEQQFLYGHHIMKNGLSRITDDTEKYQGAVIYSMADLPLGFGVSAKSAAECRHADPMAIIAFHQADIGEYLRSEENLV
jgi:60S ribosome subunit biogenesis protein NIP7